MSTEILIVQRFFYNFREGFFEYLNEKGINFKLINSTESRGRVTVHKSAKTKSYIIKTTLFGAGKNYIIFPFLLFKIFSINPRWIISEGGQNTVNNIHVLLYHFLTGKSYIIWDLGKGYDEFPDTFFRKIYMFFYRLTLRKAAFIYTYNTSGLEYFGKLGLDTKKVLVLNNTVDTRKIRRIREKSVQQVPGDILERVNKEKTCLIFVGALLPSKNIEDLKQLMDMLGPGYILIIVGDGEINYKNKLIGLFQNSNVIFAGYKSIDEITPYYNLAQLSILPGLGGLSINQAMAFGLPVICRSADGAEKDLVENDKTGYIYSSINEAADYIKSKNSDEWKYMGSEAEKLIYTQHSLENMTDKFLSKVSNRNA